MSIDSAQGLGELVYRKKQAYMNNDQELQRRYQQSAELTDLLALQELKSQKEAMKRKQAAEANTNPQTIAQQTEQQVLGLIKEEQQQGLGALRNKVQQVGGILGQRQREAQQRQKRMGIATAAQGGIVGFKKGSIVEDLESLGYTVEEYSKLPKKQREQITEVINARRSIRGLPADAIQQGELELARLVDIGYEKAGDTLSEAITSPTGKALRSMVGMDVDLFEEPTTYEGKVEDTLRQFKEDAKPVGMEDVDVAALQQGSADRRAAGTMAEQGSNLTPKKEEATGILSGQEQETTSGAQTTTGGTQTTTGSTAPARDMYQEAIDAAAVAEPKVKTDVRTAVTDLLDASGASERMKLDPEKVRTDALEKRKKELNLEEMLDTQDEQLEEFEDFVRDTDKEERLLDWLGATSAASAYGGPGGFAAGYRNARLASIARKNDQLIKKRGIQNKKLELEADVLNKGIQSADQAVTTWQTEKNNTEKLMADATKSDYELADSVANRRSSENVQKSKVMLQRLADKTDREIAAAEGDRDEYARLGDILSDSVAARVTALQPIYAEVGLDLQDTDVTNAEISSKLAAASISQKMLEEAAGLIAQEQDILRRMERLIPGSVTQQLKEAQKTAEVLAGVSATQKYKEDEKGIMGTIRDVASNFDFGLAGLLGGDET